MFRLHKNLVLTFLAALLIIGLITPVQAKSDSKGGGYWLPNDEETIEKAKELLKKGKSLRGLEIKRDQKQKKEGLQTLEQLQKQAEQNETTYKVNMAPPIKTADKWVAPEFDYDHIQTTYECQQNPKSNSETGYLKNRYSFCWTHVATYQVPVKCFMGICLNEGVTFQFTEIGFGSNQSRKMRVYYTIEDIFVSHPSLNGAKLKIDMKCEAKLNEGDCIEDEDYPPTEQTIAQWKNSNFGNEIFLSEAPPATEANPDRLGFMDFWPELTFTYKPTKFSGTIDGIKQTVRFDSARYLFAFPDQHFWQGAVFSNAVPIFNVPVTKPEFSMLEDAGLHWKFAMDHPEQTIPEEIGKKIPGEVGKRKLHRMYTRRHPDDYQRNRNKTRRVCQQEFGGNDNTGKQCDEFPFASTWEGSATNGSENFSIKMISADSNQAAGTWLGAWYAYDRVLDGDGFYVQVEAPEKVGTITSEGQPLEDEDHRSSENFSIQNIPPYATKLKWKIVDGPANVQFDLMHDDSLGIDETIFNDIQDGTVTEIKTGDEFYIANPENTNGESFTIEVYAVPE